MPTTLFTGGTIRTARGAEADEWVLVRDDVVEAVGGGDAPSADRTVDLDGATLVPGFRDAHVHLPATGLYALGLDFRGERSARAILDAFAGRAAAEPDAVLFGGNFEDPLDEPLVGAQLSDAVGNRPALLARADMHSCVVSDALLRELALDDVDGVDRDATGRPTGYLREQAAARAWSWFDARLTPGQQRAAVNAAIELAHSKGVTEVHEMFVVEWRGWPSMQVFFDAIDGAPLDVVVFLGTDEVDKVVELDLPRIGGDFFLDGSFGSHTAWMSEPFVSPPPPGSSPTGISYRSDDEVFEFFRAAQSAGLQVGVHAIGDAAIEQAIATWEKVAQSVGVNAVRAQRHRIEHFECATDDHIERARRLGLVASVQPAFDRLWGGSDGLYADRIGWDRASAMNRFGTMHAAGLELLSGSDSTVTPLDPMLAMASLRDHHMAEESLDAATALALNVAGPIRPGGPANLAALDRDPLAVEPDELVNVEVLSTWVGGAKVWA